MGPLPCQPFDGVYVRWQLFACGVFKTRWSGFKHGSHLLTPVEMAIVKFISLGGGFKHFWNFHPENWEDEPILTV